MVMPAFKDSTVSQNIEISLQPQISRMVDQVVLPSYILSYEDFQSLKVPLINNFRVQQGADVLKQKSAQKLTANLLQNRRLDRKFAIFMALIIGIVILLVVTVLVLLVIKLTKK